MSTVRLLGAVDLPGSPSSIAVARAYVRKLPGVAGHPRADEVELLVSELVANAVQHSDSGRRPQGMLRLVVADHDHTLHVEVIDEGSSGTIPQVPAQVDSLSENGRGLWLVQELSSAWGWKESETGRVVWFDLPTRPQQP
ncbi:ATP-binding protein [Streptosporangium sp. NPDC002607]